MCQDRLYAIASEAIWLAVMKSAFLSHRRKIKKLSHKRHGGEGDGMMEVDGIDCAHGGSTDEFV